MIDALDLSLRNLEALLVLDRELHFGRAAKAIGITQPTFSGHIRKVERAVGAELFTRRPVAVTDVGRAFINALRQGMSSLDGAFDEARATVAGEAGVLRDELPPEPPAPKPDGYKEGASYALWCAWLGGFGGLHRIYMGKYFTGTLWLCTWGLLGVGQLIDLFAMKRLVHSANIRAGYIPHPRWADRVAAGASPPALPAHVRKPLKHLLLDAAIAQGGELSVTEGVAATGASFEAVEKTLTHLVTTGYVDIDNRPGSGVTVYRFSELR